MSDEQRTIVPTCRVRLTEYDKRRLWSESGGYCHDPACAAFLFGEDADADFGELAHIIPASPGGPRDVPIDEMSIPSRADHSNVLLLCANTHTVVDKAPDKYPVDLLRSWKDRHIDRLTALFSAPRFDTRSDALAHIEPLMMRNQAVHEHYGPTANPYASGQPALWRRQARSTIVPNNKTLVRVLNANRHLLTEAERSTLTLFELHAEQFENRHVLGDWTTGTERFPDGMSAMLRSEPGDGGSR